MNENPVYISYGENAVVYDTEKGLFSLRLSQEGKGIMNASLIIEKPDGSFADIKNCKEFSCKRKFKAFHS